MRKKILVLGATGMAGHVIFLYLGRTNKYEMQNITFRKKLTHDSVLCDVRDHDQLNNVLLEMRPAIVINCVGALIKDSVDSPENAIYLNAYLPNALKKSCEAIGARLFHISTDCVFSGKKGNYSEHDFRDADDVYGRSKALGEIIDDRHLCIRTSIIGPELKVDGEGLFLWFMSQTGIVNGFSRVYWSGVTTLELAKAIDNFIGNETCGLVHLTNGVKISKHDLLVLLKEVWNRSDISIIPFDAKCVDKSLQRSIRSDFSVLSYNDMLLELEKWIRLQSNLYKHLYLRRE